ncbi:MAG: spondin domain-containing protein [Rubrivivax sp.]|nr:spondin domain-containing protein [Rubrivivax sp.]
MSQPLHACLRSAACAAALMVAGAASQAALVDVTVTVHNLQPANSVSFAALHLGFNNGSFDAFNIGEVATAPIISVAELGTGAQWQAAFAAADPAATRGVVAGRLDPGATRSATFRVDTSLNRYFTFASMVVPSNDFFIGNDDPLEYLLLDTDGNLLIPSITVGASEIWDAGSEIFDPAAAAFVGTSSLRRDQNSVVAFNFAELAAFNGLTTAAGTTFSSALTADSDIYRIGFSVTAVPEPGSYALMAAGLMAVGFVVRRRRVDTAQGGNAMA